MDIATYAAEAELEAEHWWYVGRRVLFSDLIKTLPLDRGAEVLDVGTSAGANLRMLRDLGLDRITGLDQSLEAAQFCAEKGFGDVRLGDICALPFNDRSFDLILATDIVEHVDDDILALSELHRVLKPGRHVLITVPTFQLLWGQEDEVSHHKRRYRMPEFLEKVCAVGLTPIRYFYFNYLLFLPILAARRLMRTFKVEVATEGEINTEWVNRILTPLFWLDVKTARWVHPPVGVSALVLATR